GRAGPSGRGGDPLGAAALEPGGGRAKELETVLAASEPLGGVLRVRHEPDDVPPGVAHAGHVRERPVRVRSDVAEHDPPLALERRERVLVRDVAALAVLDREREDLPRLAEMGERRVDRLDPHRDRFADEAERPVPDERARQETGLAEYLEAVADP